MDATRYLVVSGRPIMLIKSDRDHRQFDHGAMSMSELSAVALVNADELTGH